jgi:hypothetical protein
MALSLGAAVENSQKAEAITPALERRVVGGDPASEQFDGL